MIFRFEMAKCVPAVPVVPALLYISDYQVNNNIIKRESSGNSGNGGKASKTFPQSGKAKCLIIKQRERRELWERKYASQMREAIENFYKNIE